MGHGPGGGPTADRPLRRGAARSLLASRHQTRIARGARRPGSAGPLKSARSPAPRVLLIDNYDSFTYNLVQDLGELGAEPVVFRNDAIDVAGIRAEAPTP